MFRDNSQSTPTVAEQALFGTVKGISARWTNLSADAIALFQTDISCNAPHHAGVEIVPSSDRTIPQPSHFCANACEG